MKSVILLILLVAAFTNAYISNIEVDKQNGQVYITSGNIIYEVDTSSVEQNAVHYLPASAEFDCLHVGKSGNKRMLFAYLESDTDEQLVTFPVPLKNQQTLKVKKAASYPRGLSWGSIFDNSDRVAILWLSRNITLIDLNTLSAYDSIRIGQNRVFGYNLVYNHQTHKLIVFHSRVPVQNPIWGLSATAYDLSNHLFEEVNSTYDCLCGEGYNSSASPFLHVEFPQNSCGVDYRTTPARIWCPYGEKNQIFNFNADDLSDFVLLNIASDFDIAIWDFPNGYAYGIDGKAAGFTVFRIRLSDGAVLATYSNANVIIDASFAKISTDDNRLFIAGYSDVPNAPETLVSVDLDNLAAPNAATVITLNTNDL